MPLRISTPTCLGDSCHVSSAPLRLISRRCLALAYQFLSRLCLRFACLCNAIATLAGHFEAVASPTCDLLCHRLLRHTLPWQFDSSQCHRMTHHCNQSPCAVRLHTSTPSHRTLRYATAYHAVLMLLKSKLCPCFSVLCLCVSFCAVPLPLLTFRYYAFADHHGSDLSFAIAE